MGRMSSNPARALAALLLIAAAVLVASAADLAPGPLAAGPGPARTKLEDASSSPPPPAETPALEAAGARFVTATTPDGETISGFVGQPLSLIADDAAIAAAAAAADAADASAAGAAARVNEGAPGQPGPAAAAAEVAAMASMFSGILSQHNSYRSRHGSPALVWNDAVASRAQNTVVSCRFAHNAQDDGENIAYTSNTDQSAALAWAVKAWYDEESKYNYASPGFSGATGHFTQVVWKGSARLGCAIRQCATMAGGRPASFISCHYSPPGNYQGQFPQNVLRPGSGGGGGGPTPPPPGPAPPPPPPRRRRRRRGRIAGL